MESIYPVLDAARIGLDMERLKASVAAENISNMNNPGYIPKTVSNVSFLDLLGKIESSTANNSYSSYTSQLEYLVEESPDKKIYLDKEVFEISNAEMRYQVLAQGIKAKFGIIELAIGGRSK